jgi:hypothetical protein
MKWCAAEPDLYRLRVWNDPGSAVHRCSAAPRPGNTGEEEMPDIKTDDGCVIHVEVEGPQNGPVLMLSNSLGTNLHMLDDQRCATPQASMSLQRPIKSSIIFSAPVSGNRKGASGSNG